LKPANSPEPFESPIAARASSRALILGLGVHGLAVARSLGRRGVRVEVADPDTRQPHRYSRYCRRFHEVPSLEDGRLVDFLIRFSRERRERTALFVTADKTVPVISSHRNLLAQHFDFILPPDGVILGLMDKTRLPEFLEKCHALYPRTIWIRKPEDLAAVGDTVGLPCVVKPALRAFGFKAAIARSATELAEVYATASRHTDKIIAQQWIPGGDSEVYFCFVYIGRDSAPKGVFVGRKLRQYPNGTGVASEAEGCENEFVREETLRLFHLAGYRGFGSTEFRRDPASGRYYLIEFTVGRTDYDVDLAVANGVDLPFLGYRDMIGLVSDDNLPCQQNGRRWVEGSRNVQAILQELAAARIGRLGTVAALAKSMSPRNVFTLFDFGDPEPFLVHAMSRALAAPRAIGRRTLRSIRGIIEPAA
jgi:D-aspartate ligase